MAVNKKLVRSNDNKMFLGLLGGLGEYFEVDPTILRLIFLVGTIFTGIFPGLFFYLLAALIVPQK